MPVPFLWLCTSYLKVAPCTSHLSPTHNASTHVSIAESCRAYQPSRLPDWRDRSRPQQCHWLTNRTPPPPASWQPSVRICTAHGFASALTDATPGSTPPLRLQNGRQKLRHGWPRIKQILLAEASSKDTSNSLRLQWASRLHKLDRDGVSRARTEKWRVARLV